MPRIVAVLGLLSLFGVCALGSPASAQDVGILAQQHFDRGVELYDRRQYEDALSSFEASSELTPSPNSTLYIARCHRGLQQLSLAVEAYERTIRQIRSSGDTTGRYAPTAAAAEEELAPIERRIGRLVLTGDLSSSATIRIGERSVPVAALGLPLPVEPGAQVVHVTDGDSSWDQTVHVRAREEVEIELSPPAVADELVPDPDPDPEDETAATPGWIFAGAFGSAAVAGIGWGLAIAFGVKANDRYAELDAQCMGGPCPPELQGAVDEGRRFQTIANAGIVVGAIGTAAALAFLIIALLRDTDEADAPLAVDAAGRIRF